MAEEEDYAIELIVKKSPISGSGIVRVNTRILDNEDFVEGGLALVKCGEKNGRVMKLVADSMMEEGMTSIRQKDMERLEVEEGERVTLHSYKGIKKRLMEKFFT